MKDNEYLLAVIQDQIRRHPGFQIKDLYKLVHQSCFGGGHLLQDRAKARKRLEDEWRNTEKIPPGETLIEVIDPSSEILRINLRVFKKTGGTVDRLFDAFEKSSESIQPNPDQFVAFWNSAIKWAENGVIDFSAEAMKDFLIDMGKENFPPVRHSKPYLEANRPSYRVVAKKFWEGFGEEAQTKKNAK